MHMTKLRLYLSVPSLVLLAGALSCGGDTADRKTGKHTGEPPLVARIASPSGTIPILTGQSIDLRAEFSADTHAVNPASIEWHSSLQGDIATGNPVPSVVLNSGTHKLQVTGTLGGN